MIETIIFYFFSLVLLASAVMVVSSRNSVHSVLLLILCFFNAAGLFILLGAEFIAFILVIVYVGAVAVLFLFVVMMLNIGVEQMRQGVRRHLPIGLAVGGILLAELVLVVTAWHFDPAGLVTLDVPQTPDAIENTRALGRVLYTDYFFPFQVSGLILLVAMIGAIVLTLRQRKDVYRQNVSRQIDRAITDVVTVVKVESGKGVL